MSTTVLNIIDNDQTVHCRVETYVADYCIAALAADPCSIREVVAAVGRFVKSDPTETILSDLSPDILEERGEAGLLIIDLVGRVIIHDCNDPPMCIGCVPFHDGVGRTNLGIDYYLGPDWDVSKDLDHWRTVIAEHRKALSDIACPDAREILFGELAKHIVQTCTAHIQAGETLDHAEIHKNWLMTPREDLNGQTPRDMLIRDAGHIDRDIQNQWHAWGLHQGPPPSLDRSSLTYRHGAMGTQEIVLYYDLTRYLISECEKHLAEVSEINEFKEMHHLKQLQQEWMHTPHEQYQGRSPAYIADLERRRLPLVMSDSGPMEDEDSPLNQIFGEIATGPAIWGLDCSHFDDEFEFSLHESRDDWEEEQLLWASQAAKFSEEWAERAAAIEEGNFDDDPWENTYVNPEIMKEFNETGNTMLVIFALGAHLSEIVEDIKTEGLDHRHVEALNNAFGRLREALQESSIWEMQSIIAEMCDTMTQISVSDRIRKKCEAFEAELDLICERVMEDHDDVDNDNDDLLNDDDREIPF